MLCSAELLWPRPTFHEMKLALHLIYGGRQKSLVCQDSYAKIGIQDAPSPRAPLDPPSREHRLGFKNRIAPRTFRRNPLVSTYVL